MIRLLHQAMRINKMTIFEAEFSCLSVHLVRKCFDIFLVAFVREFKSILYHSINVFLAIGKVIYFAFVRQHRQI